MSSTRLPDTLIVGAMKSGTSALAQHLAEHPDVYFSPEKEIHFFNRVELWDRGLDWYQRFFAGATTEARVAEGSPSTMFYPDSVERLAKTLPDARLIAILRHPVDRTWSQYWHEQAIGKQLGTFEEAVERQLTAPEEPFIVERSRYLPQLEQLAVHYPRERIHVVLLDDLVAEPRRTYAEVCRFLDIDAAYVPSELTEVINPSKDIRFMPVLRGLYHIKAWNWLPKRVSGPLYRSFFRPAQRPEMDLAIRTRLIEVFRADNAALAAWLGRDLSAWNF